MQKEIFLFFVFRYKTVQSKLIPFPVFDHTYFRFPGDQKSLFIKSRFVLIRMLSVFDHRLKLKKTGFCHLTFKDRKLIRFHNTIQILCGHSTDLFCHLRGDDLQIAAPCKAHDAALRQSAKGVIIIDSLHTGDLRMIRVYIVQTHKEIVLMAIGIGTQIIQNLQICQ